MERSKPVTFDLEAAKRGEPIEYLEAYGWVEIKFIGSWTDDAVVCQVPWNDKPEIVPVNKIRMGKKVARYKVGLFKAGNYLWTDSADYESDLKKFEEHDHFVEWITDWQEYEIGANDE
jgi:hypothetical protein